MLKLYNRERSGNCYKGAERDFLRAGPRALDARRALVE